MEGAEDGLECMQLRKQDSIKQKWRDNEPEICLDFFFSTESLYLTASHTYILILWFNIYSNARESWS